MALATVELSRNDAENEHHPRRYRRWRWRNQSSRKSNLITLNKFERNSIPATAKDVPSFNLKSRTMVSYQFQWELSGYWNLLANCRFRGNYQTFVTYSNSWLRCFEIAKICFSIQVIRVNRLLEVKRVCFQSISTKIDHKVILVFRTLCSRKKAQLTFLNIKSNLDVEDANLQL